MPDTSSYQITRSAERTRSMVACKVCDAHFDLVPGVALFEDEPDDGPLARAGACPVCGSTRVYEGVDFFLVPAA